MEFWAPSGFMPRSMCYMSAQNPDIFFALVVGGVIQGLAYTVMAGGLCFIMRFHPTVRQWHRTDRLLGWGTAGYFVGCAGGHFFDVALHWWPEYYRIYSYWTLASGSIAWLTIMTAARRHFPMLREVLRDTLVEVRRTLARLRAKVPK